ncbi:MAG: hypothetical protein KGD67_01170 [Candidatus Lokiarchaeota archaeon]|nr:hypothetical protein [Candidatus Lokiarchaeota archaeon]
MTILIAALIAVVIFAVVSIIQLLLALGLPLGKLAYGGKYERLPTNMRIMSVVAIGIFVLASISVLERAGIIILFNNPIFTLVVVWVIAIYLALNTLLNALSKSKKEKIVMTPLSLIAAICCFVIAILA